MARAIAFAIQALHYNTLIPITLSIPVSHLRLPQGHLRLLQAYVIFATTPEGVKG